MSTTSHNKRVSIASNCRVSLEICKQCAEAKGKYCGPGSHGHLCGRPATGKKRTPLLYR